VRPIDNPDELLCTTHRVIKGLLAMALSARYLSELQQIDRLLTHDVFDALCHCGIPMSRVSELVWPAVEALEHQACLLGMSWRPSLCQGDWLMPNPREATGDARAVSAASVARAAPALDRSESATIDCLDAGGPHTNSRASCLVRDKYTDDSAR
jgi:hypothetical protein